MDRSIRSSAGEVQAVAVTGSADADLAVLDEGDRADIHS